MSATTTERSDRLYNDIWHFLHIPSTGDSAEDTRHIVRQKLGAIGSDEEDVTRLFVELQAYREETCRGSRSLVDVLWAMGEYITRLRGLIVHECTKFDYVLADGNCFRLPCWILRTWGKNETSLHDIVREGLTRHTDVCGHYISDGNTKCLCSKNGSMVYSWNHLSRICPAYSATQALLYSDRQAAYQILQDELSKEGDDSLPHHVYERICAALHAYFTEGEAPIIATIGDNDREGLQALVPHIVRADRFCNNDRAPEPAVVLCVSGVLGTWAVPSLSSLFGATNPDSEHNPRSYYGALECLDRIGGARAIIENHGGQSEAGNIRVAQTIKRIADCHTSRASIKPLISDCMLGDDAQAALDWLLPFASSRPIDQKNKLRTLAFEALCSVLSSTDGIRCSEESLHQALAEVFARYNEGLIDTRILSETLACLPQEGRDQIRAVIADLKKERMLHVNVMKLLRDVSRTFREGGDTRVAAASGWLAAQSSVTPALSQQFALFTTHLAQLAGQNDRL